jgi:hypothetical protein
MCGRCGVKPPRPARRTCEGCAADLKSDRAKWAAKNPFRIQANKNAYWQTEAGKAFIKKRAKKFNAYRKKWRAEKAKALKDKILGYCLPHES